MHPFLSRFSLALFLVLGGLGVLAQSAPARAATAGTQGQEPVPVPPAEQNVKADAAKLWFTASDENHVLEGAAFDHSGNLFFCDVTARRVLRLTPDKQLSTVVALDAFAPGGLAFHKDGRLFIAALDMEKELGTIVAVRPDGTRMETILPADAGYMPNDLVFDREGGFYFTDFKGTATEPKGGVYYATPADWEIKPVLPHLAMANGIALSPDGATLWATEFGRNLLHRMELAGPAAIAPIGSTVPYHFTGPAPDSMRTDIDGNVYVALYGQGRILIFNENGIPIGQILLPGREQGKNLLSTSLAIRPGEKELYAVAGNNAKTEGARVFQAKAFGGGLPPSASK